MITDVFLSIGTVVLGALIKLMQAINFVIPDSIKNSLTYLLGHLKYFSGVFPVSDLLTCLSLLLTFWIGVSTLKIAFMIMNGVPIFGSNFYFPNEQNKK